MQTRHGKSTLTMPREAIHYPARYRRCARARRSIFSIGKAAKRDAANRRGRVCNELTVCNSVPSGHDSGH